MFDEMPSHQFMSAVLVPGSTLEGTPVVDSSASATSALTTKEEKTTMEMLAEIKATLDRMIAKVDVFLSPPTLTVASSTTNSTAPHAGSDSSVNSHDKCSTFGLVPAASVIHVAEAPLVAKVMPLIAPIPIGASPFPSSRQPAVLKPDKRTPTTCSTGILQDEFDAMHAKQDITAVLVSTASIPQVHAALPVADMSKDLQVGNVMPFDPGTKLQPRISVLVAIPPAWTEVYVLPGGLENHDRVNLDTICSNIHAANNHWSSKISSCVILINCEQCNLY